jgi:glyoxylase-like metal-dependent hydrolase (beta-lactamase superfamily II)
LVQFQEVYPRVLSLALPLPFELESVNVFLIALEAGYLLIDCGMQTKPAFETLEGAMEQRGIEWRDIRQIVLTHMHPDHMGLAARLVELTGAELAMHQAEAEHLRLVTGGNRRIPWLAEAYLQSGVPAPLETKMEEHFAEIRQNFHDLAPTRLFVGGEKLETALGPLEVIWTSGHSPGHICLYSRERKLLFSGDQILEKITPNIAWHPGRDMLAEFLESLALLDSLDIELIVPSHGGPFSGHRAWIRETIGHHRERCDQMIGLLAQAPRTAHQMVGEMWRRQLSPINHHFAIFEVLAHLEHLKRQGKVHPSADHGAIMWRA